jgi:hypothetical protein
MATFLDATGIGYFSSALVFVFVLIGVFAILTAMKFPAPPWVNAVLGTILALFVVISPTATRIAQNVAPWFAVLAFLVVLIAMAAKMVGGGEDVINKTLVPVFLFLILVFVLAPTAREGINIPGDNETSTDFDRDYSQTSTVLFHPKVMGIVLIFAVAVATVGLLISARVQ